MSSTYNPGRVAGFLHLLLGFSVFRPVYVAGRLIVRQDASATANNIKAHELLFRMGIVSDVLAGISCILVALALYQVLKGVDQKLAVLMVILGGLVPGIVDFLNVGSDIAALLLARGDDFLSVFEKPQRAALAMKLRPTRPHRRRLANVPL